MTLRRFVLVWSLLAFFLAGAHGTWPSAFIVVGVFMLVCPGAGFVRSLDLDEHLMSVVILVSSSLALDVLVAETLLYLHLYTGARAIGVLAAIAIIGVSWPNGGRVRRSSGNARMPAYAKAPELDNSLPVLLVRIGQYPVYHGTVGAIRSLGRAGVQVHAIVEDRYTPAAVSRYLRSRSVWSTTGAEDEAELVEGLMRIGEELGGGVLAIPSDDEAAVLLAEHQDELRQWFVYPDVAPDLPRRLASKRGLYEACRAAGVPTPDAMFPQSKRDLRMFANRAAFPVVVKNVDPWRRLNEAAVQGTTVVNSAAELLALAETFVDPSTAMIQEYIPREDAEDWIFHAYCDASSEPLVAFTGIKLRSWPPHAGVTTYARAVPNEQLHELSVQLCRSLGYHGVLDLDWRFDRRDGQYKLVDFNPRTGAQFRLFETESGIDVVRALHLDLSGRAVPVSAVRYGAGITVENLDAPAKIAYRGRVATSPPGVSAGPRPQRAWFAGDDLAPFFVMMVRFARPALKRLRSSRRRAAQRDATALASRGAANSVPHTKRKSGPNVPAAGNPAKNSPGTDDSNDPSSAGKPAVRAIRARKSRSKKSMASTSGR
jgi:predicted ATP-grasp superfamily ATP-dependent carboligase